MLLIKIFMKRIIIGLLVILSFLLTTLSAYAQPNPNDGSGGSPVGEAPLGSGLISLIFWGILYIILNTNKRKRRSL